MVYHANHAGTGAGYQGGDHGAVDYSMLGPDGEDEQFKYDAAKQYQDKDDNKLGGGYESSKHEEDGQKKEREARGLDKKVIDNDKPKYEKKDEASEEDIKRKAASEIHSEI